MHELDALTGLVEQAQVHGGRVGAPREPYASLCAVGRGSRRGIVVDVVAIGRATPITSTTTARIEWGGSAPE